MTGPRHIAIDARWIFPKLSGIGLYTQELIASLVEAGSPHRFTLLFNDADVLARTAEQTGFDRNAAFAAELVRGGPYDPAGQLTLPLRLRRIGVDTYHSTHAMMPLYGMRGIRRVVTIHDLIPLLFRDHAPRAKKSRMFRVYRWLVREVAARADIIVAVSESTQRDIIAHLDLPPGGGDKIRVIYEGVNPVYRPAPKPARAHVEFLFVGRRDPYKNLPMLIEALATLKREDLPVRLRVVGADDPRYPEGPETARRLGVDDLIDWAGYVDDAALVRAYQETDVYVLPSRYEGFGLPVLEAMACGTPVICSNTSSLPEVAGSAALLIDPARPETLVAAMRRAASEPGLRSSLARIGLAHAARFSWRDTAAKTLALYDGAG